MEKLTKAEREKKIYEAHYNIQIEDCKIILGLLFPPLFIVFWLFE